MIYCPGHNGVCENEIADSLAKTGAKKARHLPCEMTATKEKIKKVNKKLTLQKWVEDGNTLNQICVRS